MVADLPPFRCSRRMLPYYTAQLRNLQLTSYSNSPYSSKINKLQSVYSSFDLLCLSSQPNNAPNNPYNQTNNRCIATADLSITNDQSLCSVLPEVNKDGGVCNHHVPRLFTRRYDERSYRERFPLVFADKQQRHWRRSKENSFASSSIASARQPDVIPEEPTADDVTQDNDSASVNEENNAARLSPHFESKSIDVIGELESDSSSSYQPSIMAPSIKAWFRCCDFNLSPSIFLLTTKEG